MSKFRQFLQQEDLNFLLTNRVPRIALTRFIGWFSQIRSPLLARLSIAVWRRFTDLDLSEAQQPQRGYGSLHECFIRELKPGARTIEPDPALLASPCDGIVGECGPVCGREVFQAKGYPYTLDELFGPGQDITPFEDGSYVTLRLTSSMYHRFHAPVDGEVEHVTFISGDCWNVNPIALKRVEKLFCRNERAVLRVRSSGGQPLAIVPVAAILVASLRLHFLDLLLHLGYRGPKEIPCAPGSARFAKGQELGWFQHGSTIIVFAPSGFSLCEGIAAGTQVRMGQALMRLPAAQRSGANAETGRCADFATNDDGCHMHAA